MQAVINMMVATALIPTKGLTLPFVSYGGSSMLTCCLGIGILLSTGRDISIGKMSNFVCRPDDPAKPKRKRSRRRKRPRVNSARGGDRMIQRALIAGGKTGGHLYPGIAVAEEIIARNPGASVTLSALKHGIESRIRSWATPETIKSHANQMARSDSSVPSRCCRHDASGATARDRARRRWLCLRPCSPWPGSVATPPPSKSRTRTRGSPTVLGPYCQAYLSGL